jgi:hypothetical protein
VGGGHKEARVRQFGRRTGTGYCWGTGVAWVPLHAYPRRTPFFPKKKIRYGSGIGHGLVRAEKKIAKTTSFFQKKLKPYRIFS